MAPVICTAVDSAVVCAERGVGGAVGLVVIGLMITCVSQCALAHHAATLLIVEVVVKWAHFPKGGSGGQVCLQRAIVQSCRGQ